MSEKVTLQEIAELAGVSRNTVSKIVNGHYSGDRETQEKVVSLLQEKNYKGMGNFTEAPEKPKTILLLAGGMVSNSFFACLLNETQQNVAASGYVLLFTGMQEAEVKAAQIPAVIKNRQVDGIVCLETFEKNFIEELLKYEIPTVFLDFSRNIWSVQGKYDVVLMNNEFQAFCLTRTLIRQGCQRIGFLGDYTHCRGFFERYQGYCNALMEHQIPLNPELCLTFPDGRDYFDAAALWSYIKSMKEMPDAFVAANDSLAISLIQVLKEHRVRIPEDVCVVGYDNIPEALTVTPPLTTVDCNREALSKTVLSCLVQRMNQPDRPRNVLYVDSTIIYRESSQK
jgi:LacI family transcriptional regulator